MQKMLKHNAKFKMFADKKNVSHKINNFSQSRKNFPVFFVICDRTE